MKANKLIKEFGIGKAYEVVAFFDMCGSLTCDCDFTIEDIKQLIESHELVESYGGLYMAKADVIDLDGWEKTSPHWLKIKQAISDVESCNV